MTVRDGWIAATVLGLTVAVAVRVTAQGTPQTPPPPPPPIQGHGGPPPPGAQPQPQPPPQAPPQGRPEDARFPAHQRPAADPAVVERGRGLYVGTCARVSRRRRPRRAAGWAEPPALAARAERPGRRAHLAGRQERPPGHDDGAPADERAGHEGRRGISAHPAGGRQQAGRAAARSAGRAEHPRRRAQLRERRSLPPSARRATRRPATFRASRPGFPSPRRSRTRGCLAAARRAAVLAGRDRPTGA